MKKKKSVWGFDTKEMDRSVSPRDDFYHYVNGGWLKKNKIPKTEARWGSFTILRYQTEHQLKNIVEDVTEKTHVKRGTPEQMIRDMYRSAMNMEKRNSLGLAPLAKYLAEIESVTDVASLQKSVTSLHTIGVGVLFGTMLDQDAKNSEKYLIYLGQDGLGMPDSDYYLKKDAESERVRDAYLPYIADILKLAGMGKKDSENAAKRIYALEARLARHWMNKVDRRVIEHIYNVRTPRELARLTPTIDWKRYFKDIGIPELQRLSVMHIGYMKGLEKELHAVAISDWKLYLRFHLINDFAGALSEKFVKRSFSFYGTVLSGTTQMKPLWRRALSAVNGSLGEQLGRLYVERHFDKASMKKMNELVDDLFEAYAERIKSLDWMNAPTKKKALQKLRMMSRKIGYPKKWKTYAGLRIRDDEYVANLMRATAFEHKRALAKLKKKVDRDEWFMYPQTVNAYNAPNMNDIAFPAAILQPPFFDVHADDAVNYGSIGSVIGHEMTHGFDDEGAKYDGKGNLKTWWTKEDEKLFKQKGALLARQFDAYQIHGVHVNGKLTLGENIADLGGASIAFDAYMRRLERTGRENIDGFTPEQRFFLSFAVFERELCTPEFEKLHMLTDPHSPGIFRINGPASNLPEFYEAFGIKKGDKLYREQTKRAKIW